MKRIVLFVTCLAFSASPLLAEDWVSLFHRMVGGTSNDPAWQEFTAAGHRIGQEDAASAQKEIAELADVYDQHPETRKVMGLFLHATAMERLTIIGGANDAFIAPFQPIVPVLLAHLYDGDPVSVESPMPLLLLWSFKQNPSVDILQPMIDLSRTEANPSGALAVVAMFCTKSRQAVFALADAMAADQPFEKRLDAIKVIDHSGGPTCTDPELVNALSVALESDWPAGTDPIVHHDGQHPDGTPIINYEGGQETIVAAAVEAAKRLGPAAMPLKADLERIAADKGHPVTAEAASEALGLLLQQAPDPNSKQIITIVEPAAPPNSAPFSPRDRGPSVVVPQPERPAVLYEPGWGYVANAGALREHIKSAKKPQASGNGIVTLRLMITATGAVRKADVTAARDPLQRAAVLKAAESWTFTPFGPEVVGIVPITFKDGVAHSFLWD